MLFGEECHDSDGSLHYIWQGKSRMGLICAYLKRIDWSQDLPLSEGEGDEEDVDESEMGWDELLIEEDNDPMDVDSDVDK